MKKRYIINLTDGERAELMKITKGGKHAVRKVQRAKILLKSDTGMIDKEISEHLNVNVRTIERVRQRCTLEGVTAALTPRPRAPRKSVLDGEAEANLVLLACSEPPEGRQRWTTGLLKDKLVELQIVDSVGDETVRRTLKKNELKPWRLERFCIPPKQNAAFVQAMEDVLEVYHRPYDSKRPQICIDETSKQLLEHTREPIAARPGTPAREDDEYKRNGTANIFLCVEPLTGQTVVKVTERRTKIDFAHFIQEICDGPYRDAEKIVLVMDNLNTHSPASLYEAFPPAEARRLVEKLEIHHTPKHGSWLDMAEIQLSVLSRQCLNQRIGSLDELRRILNRWESRHNSEEHTISWRFTTEDARIKLRRLYPVL
ncbi:MAG: IS630 family transposase [Deltaproteobacteria bacterium]|nr:IS630 family transposase [Deltaproteobacteria bacterium]